MTIKQRELIKLLYNGIYSVSYNGDSPYDAGCLYEDENIKGEVIKKDDYKIGCGQLVIKILN